MTVEMFGTPREKREFKSDRRKPEFLDLNSTATVRILTNTRLSIFTHYISRSTVQCLGEDCPVCRNNKNIIMQNDKEFRKDPNYYPRRELRLVNVLDKTPSRVCECGIESRTTEGAVTCKCGKIITGTASPLNKVKILSRGVTLFDQLDAINNAIRDSFGEIVGITNYDMTLVVAGTGKDKIITPVPGMQSPLTEVAESELFDLEAITPRLKDMEMLDLQRGVSMRDIFAARRAGEKSVSTEVDFLSKESVDDLNSAVDELFKMN